MRTERLFLGFETAYWIWRKVGPLGLAALTPTRVRSLAGGAPTLAKTEAFRKSHPDLVVGDIDVLVQEGDNRAIPNVRIHMRKARYPEHSFYQIDDDVLIASPELCLIQLASKLPEPEVVKLAMEMCGTYAIDPLYDDPGFCKRPALTSTAKLRAYACKMYKPDSRAQPVKFVRWVVDGSASPRETALYMLLCMPPRFGGYGIAQPELNARVELNLKDKLMSGNSYYACDLLWRDRHVAAEYDSAQFHTAQERQERDAMRRNMLQYKGVQIITVTRTQINRPGQFDKLARQIARAVGKRLRTPEKEHVEARSTLRKTLFSWDVVPRPADAADASGT